MLKDFVNPLKIGAVKFAALLILSTSAEERRRFWEIELFPF